MKERGERGGRGREGGRKGGRGEGEGRGERERDAIYFNIFIKEKSILNLSKNFLL